MLCDFTNHFLVPRMYVCEELIMSKKADENLEGFDFQCKKHLHWFTYVYEFDVLF